MQKERALQRERAFLKGSVTDRISGRPIPGAHVAILDDAGEVLADRWTDDSGRYHDMNLPAGNWTLKLWAPTRTWNPQWVLTRRISLERNDRIDLPLEFDLRDYPDPPCRSVRGEFTGRHFFGFEASDFVPDDKD